MAPKVLDLNDSVAGMLKMLLRLIGEDIDLVWMPGADLWPVKIDPSQIDQLLANLCVNARDAIAGVGKVTIETGNITFDEAYCAVHPGFICGEYVMLAVSDDGCGMSKEVLIASSNRSSPRRRWEKARDWGWPPCTVLSSKTRDSSTSTANPAMASTFKIYLPRFVGGSIKPMPRKQWKRPRATGRRCCWWRTKRRSWTWAEAMLEELGYTVLTAGTPGEALRQAKAPWSEIQLLITDVVMPEMNGRDLAKLIDESNRA